MVTLEDCEALKETEKALLVYINLMNEDHWIPHDHIAQEESEVLREGDEGTLVITDWIAEKIGAL